MKLSLQINPDNRPASWDQIKAARETHAESPIGTSYGLLDADTFSLQRLEDAQSIYEDLPDGAGHTFMWKSADNNWVTIPLDKLPGVIKGLRKKKAIRRDRLMMKGEEFKAMDVYPTPRQLSDINHWIK